MLSVDYEEPASPVLPMPPYMECPEQQAYPLIIASPPVPLELVSQSEEPCVLSTQPMPPSFLPPPVASGQRVQASPSPPPSLLCPLAVQVSVSKTPTTGRPLLLDQLLEPPSPRRAQGDGEGLGKKGAMDGETIAGLLVNKTTVMMRNIPNRYTCEELLSEVMAAGFDDTFDFFYLPMDFKTKRNRGYGFINFESPDIAQKFVRSFHQRRLLLHPSKKIVEVAPAVTQGYEANMSKYFKKDLERIKNDWFRPMLFSKS